MISFLWVILRFDVKWDRGTFISLSEGMKMRGAKPEANGILKGSRVVRAMRLSEAMLPFLPSLPHPHPVRYRLLHRKAHWEPLGHLLSLYLT